MKRSILVFGLLGILVASAFGQANILQAKIPFEFVVGGVTAPAGNYDFGISNNLVRVTNRDTGRIITQLWPRTRIAADSTANGSARISFDLQGTKHFIEAIWPQQGEGYVLNAVKGEHTHEVIRLK